VTPRAAFTAATSLLLVGVGLAVLVESAVVGGGTAGYLFGTLFVLAGAGRLYLSRR
jgi:hypothetical protein